MQQAPNTFVPQHNWYCHTVCSYRIVASFGVGDASSVSRQLPFGSGLQPNQTAASSPVSFKSGSNSPQTQRQVGLKPPPPLSRSCLACPRPSLLLLLHPIHTQTLRSLPPNPPPSHHPHAHCQCSEFYQQQRTAFAECISTSAHTQAETACVQVLRINPGLAECLSVILRDR